MKGYIYMLRNEKNGKVYVGQTVDLKRRMAYHFTPSTCRHNTNPLYADIQKYGRDVFSHFVLEEITAETENEFKTAMALAEKKWILKKDSIRVGYNLELGNELTEEMKTKLSGLRKGVPLSKNTREKIGKTLREIGGSRKGPLTEAAKEKLRAANLGKRHSVETKERMSAVKKGSQNPFFGKTHSRLSLGKMSENRKGKLAGAQNPAARKIENVTTGAVFDTIKEAAAFYGLTASNISSACRGSLKTCGGFQWKYI